ncbi:MAG TPA: TIGR01777 family protein [Leptospiraceae bacterium]|nr:TIGR01777 family protein [Spirochaetaceae bacterium]HBS06286.1 TIGR01777 family protein [Leptospiraceae bacterium]|tara:strand:+ start:31013 stop:31945 length:933 start_codon:yes stop_codon:yes gene_type:complete
MAPSNRTVIIAGGSGYLGLNLARYLLHSGYSVSILSRKVPKDIPTGAKHINWDGRTLGDWAANLEGCHALVNLTGRTVDCIKTPETMDQILRSRVESTAILGEALKTVRKKPSVWVQMSTAHIYGDSLELCDERSAFGYGLAPDVGRAWEETFNRALPRGMRGVILRTSFVIGPSGGALQRLALLVRLGLGGTVGHGKQGMSWIHEEDMNRLFQMAIEDRKMKGPYIASAPEPRSQKEFMRALRKSMRMPIGLPAAGWMVRLGAPLLMRTDPDLALYGRYVIPGRLMNDGFQFLYPNLESALDRKSRNLG